MNVNTPANQTLRVPHGGKRGLRRRAVLAVQVAAGQATSVIANDHTICLTICHTITKGTLHTCIKEIAINKSEARGVPGLSMGTILKTKVSLSSYEYK